MVPRVPRVVSETKELKELVVGETPRKTKDENKCANVVSVQ